MIIYLSPEQKLALLEQRLADVEAELKRILAMVQQGHEATQDLFEAVGAHARMLHYMTTPPDLPAVERPFGKGNSVN